MRYGSLGVRDTEGTVGGPAMGVCYAGEERERERRNRIPKVDNINVECGTRLRIVSVEGLTETQTGLNMGINLIMY